MQEAVSFPSLPSKPPLNLLPASTTCAASRTPPLPSHLSLTAAPYPYHHLPTFATQSIMSGEALVSLLFACADTTCFKTLPSLCREENGLAEQINIDLTYSVCFNLANQYHVCGMYTEALNTYTLIVKNKQYAQSGRLRVNMGNIYYEQAREGDKERGDTSIQRWVISLALVGSAACVSRHKGFHFMLLLSFAEEVLRCD